MAVLFDVVCFSNGYGYQTRLKGEATQLSQNVAGNYSTIKRKVYGYTTGYTTASHGVTVKVNGGIVFNNGYVNFTTTPKVFLEDTINVSHNSDGAGNYTMSGEMVMSGMGGHGSGSGTLWLTTIPRASAITNFPNFDVDSNIKVGINKKSNSFTDTLQLFCGDTLIKTISNYRNNVNFTLSAEQKTAVYSLMKTVNSATFTAKITTFNGSSAIGTDTTNSKGSISSANPQMSNFEWEQTNNLSISSKYTIIKGKSRIIVTIGNVLPKKGATITNYQVTIGTRTIIKDAKVITLEAVDSNIITIYAIDSRGNTSSLQKVATSYIQYNDIILSNVSYSRGDGGIGSETALIFDGTMWVGDFGLYDNVVVASYQFKELGTDIWTQGQTQLIVSTQNNFSLEQLIKGDLLALGFDSKKDFDIVVQVQDRIMLSRKQIVITKGMPSLAIAKGGMSVGGFYDENLGGSLQVDGYQMTPSTTLVEKDRIPGYTDLNTYRTTGLYLQPGNSYAATGSNYPVALAGHLTVVAPDTNYISQTYHVYSNQDVYVRTYYNSWTAWKPVALQGDDASFANVNANRVLVGGSDIVRTDKPSGWDERIMFSNGTMILRYWTRGSISVTSPWGVLYEGYLPNISKKKYPTLFPFKENPQEIYSSGGYDEGSLAHLIEYNSGTRLQTGAYYAVRPTTYTFNINYGIVVIGRWK